MKATAKQAACAGEYQDDYISPLADLIAENISQARIISNAKQIASDEIDVCRESLSQIRRHTSGGTRMEGHYMGALGFAESMNRTLSPSLVEVSEIASREVLELLISLRNQKEFQSRKEAV